MEFEMKYQFAFIGCGNMGSALSSGVAKRINPEKIALCDTSIEKAEALSEKIGAVSTDVADAVLNSEYIFIAVKPQGYAALAEEIKPILKSRGTPPVFISMAAGTSIEKLTALLGGSYPIIRIMPNTPVAVGAGITLYSQNCLVSEEHIEAFSSAMTETGLTLPIDEDKFDSETIVTGCGPAYVFAFIDALTGAAEALGVSKESAALYAKQTVLGAARLAVESDETPKKLCERVCSPGGSTIEGIRLMERRELADTVKAAARASYDRTLEMKKL